MSQVPGAAGNYQQALQMKGVDAGTAERLAKGSMAGSKQGTLNPEAKKLMNSAFKKDFCAVSSADVRKQAYSSQSLSATAYASGGDVKFGSSPSQHTAAHEAAHVVQQKGGGPAYPGSASSAGARGNGGLSGVGGGGGMVEEEELQM